MIGAVKRTVSQIRCGPKRGPYLKHFTFHGAAIFQNSKSSLRFCEKREIMWCIIIQAKSNSSNNAFYDNHRYSQGISKSWWSEIIYLLLFWLFKKFSALTLWAVLQTVVKLDSFGNPAPNTKSKTCSESILFIKIMLEIASSEKYPYILPIVN